MSEKNPDLLRAGMVNILTNTSNHDQSAWIAKKYDEAGGMCGTTMCLAGHVAVVAGAEFPPVMSKDWDGEWHVNDEGKYRTQEEYAEYSWNGGDERVRELYMWASEKLGLSYDEREYLFYFYGDAEDLAERVDQVAAAWESGKEFVPDYY